MKPFIENMCLSLWCGTVHCNSVGTHNLNNFFFWTADLSFPNHSAVCRRHKCDSSLDPYGLGLKSLQLHSAGFFIIFTSRNHLWFSTSSFTAPICLDAWKTTLLIGSSKCQLYSPAGFNNSSQRVYVCLCQPYHSSVTLDQNTEFDCQCQTTWAPHYVSIHVLFSKVFSTIYFN